MEDYAYYPPQLYLPTTNGTANPDSFCQDRDVNMLPVDLDVNTLHVNTEARTYGGHYWTQGHTMDMHQAPSYISYPITNTFPLELSAQLPVQQPPPPLDPTYLDPTYLELNAKLPVQPSLPLSVEDEDSEQEPDTLEALLRQQDDSTHMDRQGPNAIRQPPTRTGTKLTSAQIATQRIKQQAQKEKRALMIEAADALRLKHKQELQDLAQMHGYTYDYLNNLFNTSSHFKTTQREPQLWNAKLHNKKNELAKSGIKVTREELARRVNEDDRYKMLSKEEEAELKQELVANRTERKKGARLHNKGAALDYRAFLSRHNEEAADLYARTGATIVTFASPSNVSDTYEPAWAATENATSFTQEVFHKSMWDISRMLQQWSTVKGQVPAVSRAEMQTECSRIINSQLKVVSRNDKAVMNYANYDTAVVIKLGVKLDGWPLQDMVSPFSITSHADLRNLIEMLRRGSCRWYRLDLSDIRKHEKLIKQREDNGEQVGRKRKERADKGKARGPRGKADLPFDSDGDISDGFNSPDPSTIAGPSKRPKRATIKKKAKTGKGKGKRSDSASNPGLSLEPRSKSVLTDTDCYTSD